MIVQVFPQAHHWILHLKNIQKFQNVSDHEDESGFTSGCQRDAP